MARAKKTDIEKVVDKLSTVSLDPLTDFDKIGQLIKTINKVVKALEEKQEISAQEKYEALIKEKAKIATQISDFKKKYNIKKTSEEE